MWTVPERLSWVTAREHVDRPRTEETRANAQDTHTCVELTTGLSNVTARVATYANDEKLREDGSHSATTKARLSIANAPATTEGAIRPRGDVTLAGTEDVLLNILVSRPGSGQDAAMATRASRKGRTARQRAGRPIKTHPPDKRPTASRQRPSLESQNRSYTVKGARTGARSRRLLWEIKKNREEKPVAADYR